MAKPASKPDEKPEAAPFDVDARLAAHLDLRRRVALAEAQIAVRRDEIARLEAERDAHARNAAESAARLRGELRGADLAALL